VVLVTDTIKRDVPVIFYDSGTKKYFMFTASAQLYSDGTGDSIEYINFQALYVQ
jgi:hypothetical protein